MEKMILRGRLYLLPIFLFCLFTRLQAQPFQVFVQADSSFSNLPALHSGAVIQHQGKIIFVGGRTNGLHGFHPPLAFPTSGRNTQIQVYDPLTNTLSTGDLTQLDDSLFEPLSSSNMQFIHHGDFLYLIGGYGWNNQTNDFVTHDILIRIFLPQMLDSISSGGNLLPCFSTIHQPFFKVCGGHAKKIGDDYYIVFGHSFDGIYNRNSSSGFFVQEYKNRVHKFNLGGNATMVVMNHTEMYDSLLFHRRDYNLIPQVFSPGTMGFTAFSGVFRRDRNLPFYTPVEIRSDGTWNEVAFEQQFAHYHSATATLLDTASGSQFNLFFGGMASYAKRNGQVVYDSLVPFVSSISMMVRSAAGNYSEWLMPDTMPGLLGTNAFFLPLQGLSLIEDEIIQMDQLSSGLQQIGWIIGGIESPDPNISLSDPGLTFASSRVFRVYINNPLAGNVAEADKKIPTFHWQNPAGERFDFTVSNAPEGSASLEFIDLSGKLVFKRTVQCKAGFNRFSEQINVLPSGIYLLNLTMPGFSSKGKVFVMH
jgi:hypothetical protein